MGGPLYGGFSPANGQPAVEVLAAREAAAL